MVTHVLKDGTKTSDIAGRTITREDFPGIYAVLDAIRKREADSDGAGAIRDAGSEKTK